MWSDPSSTNMANENQWMNPAFYKNMSNEQVDWASLAQQWIKMKETSSTMSPGKVWIPEQSLLKLNQNIEPQNPSNAAAVKNKMLVDHIVAHPDTKNIIEKPSDWNSWTWQQQQQWNWNWASFSTSPLTKAPIIESVNSLGPSFTPIILSKPPQSFPIMTLKKPFLPNNYRAGLNTTILPFTESEQIKLNRTSDEDDITQDPSFIDAAKRKQLPAWIREGLEKMEKEKRRKIKQELSFAELDYSNFMNENVTQELPNVPNSPVDFVHETQMVDNDEQMSSDYTSDTESLKNEFVKNDPSPIIPRKTKAQIWEDTMLSLRTILTTLLMDVTNDMMLSVVKEVLKTTLQSDIQGNQNQTSLANKLGLAVYDSESESSDASDEEQQKSSHKQIKQYSDKAIQERIFKRQREFSNIEARILMELDQLENQEKLVRSKFDNSIKLSEEINDNSSQVVENIETKESNEYEESSLNINFDIITKELPIDLNIKHEEEKKKSKSKSSSSSSLSSSSSDSIKSDNTDSKLSYKKNNKIKSKSTNKKTKTEYVKIKQRHLFQNTSRNKSRSHSKSKHRRSRSKHSLKSKLSQSPLSCRSYSKKYKSKRNSSSSSNESRSNKHRCRH